MDFAPFCEPRRLPGKKKSPTGEGGARLTGYCRAWRLEHAPREMIGKCVGLRSETEADAHNEAAGSPFDREDRRLDLLLIEPSPHIAHRGADVLGRHGDLPGFHHVAPCLRAARGCAGFPVAAA